MNSGRLAEYLKARRDRVQPSDVGLVVGPGLRRVPGLRREELAVLAGISTDYYLRLEQGRDVHPSDQVVDALRRALKLDPAESAYLRSLARPADAAGAAGPGDPVDESALWLIASWSLAAAMVHNRYIDVLASNPLARAINPNYRAGVNSVLALMVDPAERALHADWEGLAASSVGLLRAVADSPHLDARLDAIVAEGKRSSAVFRQHWDRQDVTGVGNGTHVLRHRDVGEMTLRYLRLPVANSEGQSIFVYVAEPGTRSAEALGELAAVAQHAG